MFSQVERPSHSRVQPFFLFSLHLHGRVNHAYSPDYANALRQFLLTREEGGKDEEGYEYEE